MVKRDPNPMNVIVDMPDILPVTPDELALIETYMRDIILEIVRLEADNDNFAETSTDNTCNSI